MFKKHGKLFGLILLTVILVLIPCSFASDNSTIIQADEPLELESEINQDFQSATDEINPKSVDYYFNSSSEVDGSGTYDNPYNTLKTDRIKSSSTIHLANGEYTLSTGRSLDGVSIIGENAEKTIIRYTGSSYSGRFTVDAEKTVTLQNVTLIGFNFDIEGGTLQATNTIFKNGVAFPTYSSATNLVNSASNSFGGAIYGYYTQDYYETYLPTIILDNCTFINNTAEYGGAILMNYGTLDISNSLFINNSAYNYGGAIAALYSVSVRVKNTKFINDISENDAGGAIYALRSSVSGNNVSFINCSATFGAGITSLNSTAALIYINATGNIAKYEGGVIYQMYNAISISDSEFKNNSARNGGAVYVDDIEIFKLEYNNFENNKASSMAGAIYCLLVRNANINNNIYSGNKANKHDDDYITDSVVLSIGNGNYTLYNGTFTFDGNLPESYDLRDYDFVTPIRDQQSGGNCWAFGSLAALESAILKLSGDSIDLSEENMKNLIQLYSDYGWTGIETNGGGYDEMAIGYLTSWLGPVLEEYEKYDDYSMLSPVLNSITHVQNIIYLKRDTYTDNDAIKEAILKYGAVSTGIYYDSSYFNSARNSYYYYGSSYSNHAVAIVGWDDNYSINNFYYKPAGNGAWIVKNSWGSSWGENGYFYVSYYDTRFAQVGISDYSYAFVFNDSEKYDKNYQYDIMGKTDYLLTGEKSIWVQNIFNATDNELLAAVSTYFRKTTDWELFIYVNNELVINKNGTCKPGYTTINLGEYIPLSAGDEFKIMFKLNASSGVEFAISEKTSANKLTYAPGISFFSKDGINWTDLYNYTFNTEEDGGHYYSSQVACIKAFTILYELKPTIKLNTTLNYNNANFIAVLYDQYDNIIRSGNVILNIEGKDYIIKIENAIANFTYTFKNIGEYEVNASYRNAKANVTLNITRIDINLNIDIQVDKNNVLINVESLLDVNTNLNISINENINEIKLINGKAMLNLKDLDFGYFNVDVKVLDDYYGGDVNSGFNITISKTKIIANDLIAYHDIQTSYNIKLEDIYGNPVSNRQVSIIIGGKSYVKTTDENGITSITLTLDKNTNYKMNILFYGDNSYFETSLNPNVEVKSTINFLDEDSILSGSRLSIGFLDKKGNVLSKNQISILINGIQSWIITDFNGEISKEISLAAGSYNINVYNPETGESISKTIKVLSRIMENKDMLIYSGATGYYQARVYGDDAKAVGAGEIVKITVNGKTQNVKTDKNGYIQFKISLTAAKTYALTAIYKNFKVSNKITVKPVLTAKNISKKKSKKIKFSAKLVNNKGKVVKGKKITFKLKGKKYTAKTNKKGIATITLKNLKVGKYTITTKYAKSTIKNTIKIRK